MLCNIHEQIRLHEGLDFAISRHCWNDLQRDRRDVLAGDEDSGAEVAVHEILGELAQLLDADRGVVIELYPYVADIWRGWIWIAGCRWVGVGLVHLFRRDSGELHPIATEGVHLLVLKVQGIVTVIAAKQERARLLSS